MVEDTLENSVMARSKLLLIGGSNFYPSDRFRLNQFIPYFKKNGLEVRFIYAIPNLYFKPKISNKPLFWIVIFISRWLRNIIYSIRVFFIRKNSYNFILISRPLLPYGKIRSYERAIFRKNIPVIFDFDDALYLDPQLKLKVDFYIKNASKISAANYILAGYSKALNINTFVIPTVIDDAKYKKKEWTYDSRGIIKFGWIGSFDAMRFALPCIKNVLNKVKDITRFELIIISDKKPSKEIVDIPFTFYKWSAENEISLLNIIDVGLMPLVNNKYQEAKSGAKLIQYMGIGIPTISTPLGVNKEIVTDSINGFHASNDLEWQTIITNILNNEYDLKRMGEDAYATAHEKYSIKAVLPSLLQLFK